MSTPMATPKSERVQFHLRMPSELDKKVRRHHERASKELPGLSLNDALVQLVARGLETGARAARSA